MRIRQYYQFIFRCSSIQDTEKFLFHGTVWVVGQRNIWMRHPLGENFCAAWDPLHLSPLVASLPMPLTSYLPIPSQRTILNCLLTSFCCSGGLWVEIEKGGSDLGDLCDLGVESNIHLAIHSFTYETWLGAFSVPGIVLGVPELSGKQSERGLCVPGTAPHHRQVLSKYYERIHWIHDDVHALITKCKRPLDLFLSYWAFFCLFFSLFSFFLSLPVFLFFTSDNKELNPPYFFFPILLYIFLLIYL